MKIFLGADHAGYVLKNALYEHLHHKGHEVEDLGARTLDEDDDYPKYAFAVATKVLGEDGAMGIMVCGSGQGMAIAANRVRGIRASVVKTAEEAKETRTDNDSNVLSLPARFLDQETAFAVVDAWLETEFSGEQRHIRRLDEIEEIYG